MKNRIKNVGNVEVLEEKGVSPTRLGMIKYENVFDFFYRTSIN